jgi:predicted MPP superfamily phosphohydrolase
VLPALLVAVAVAGIACAAYGVLIERQWYRLVRRRLDILPADAPAPITVLHLSDLHIVRGSERLRRFLTTLPRVDVTAVTGDIVGEPEAVEEATELLRAVRGSTGSFFVLGSNDYYVPRPLNPLRYFLRDPRRRRVAARGRAADLVRRLQADGWVYLGNTVTTALVNGMPFQLMGLDDPHIDRQDLRVAARRSAARSSGPGSQPSRRAHGEPFGIGVVHSPDPMPELAALGWDLVLYGHTHGGQVRMPIAGALITNSDLPRRLASGLVRLGDAYAHVSQGLGTSKYAPFRLLCRPEATVLELRPAGPTVDSRGGLGQRSAGRAVSPRA